jgi:hypothetical protein
MNLTKSTIRTLTQKALLEQNINASVDSIEWLGVRCKDRFGGLFSRTARVILSVDSNRVHKVATIWNDGSYRIS